MALKMPTIEATCPIQKMNIHLMISVFISARSTFVATLSRRAELFVSRALSIASEILVACFSSKAGRSSSKTFNVLAYAIKTSYVGILNCLRGFVKLPLPLCFLFWTLALSSAYAVNIRTPFVSVTAQSVVPGEEYSLRANGLRALKIYNKGNEKIRVKFEVIPVGREGFEALPDAGWISFEKESLEIAAGAFAETDVLINVPDEKGSYGRKFAAVIVSAGSVGGNISAGLRSKLFFETLKKKNLWQKIKGWF